MHVYELAEDTDGRVGAIIQGPPHVAVLHRFTVDHLRRGRGVDPPFRQHGATAGATAVKHEQPEARVVAQRRGQAAAADFQPLRRGQPPGRVALHAEGAPDRFAQVPGDRATGRGGHERGDDLCLAGAVIPARTGFGGALQRCHQPHDGAGLLGDLRLEHGAAVRGRVRVGLVPGDARGHLQQVAHADAVIGGALELRQVAQQRVVEAFDVPVPDRGAGQRGHHGLDHGHGHPLCLSRVAKEIALEDHGVAMHHEQTGDAVQGQDVGQMPAPSVGFEGEVVEAPAGLAQRIGLGACLDHAGRKQALDVAEGVDLEVRIQRAAVQRAHVADGLVDMQVGGLRGGREHRRRERQRQNRGQGPQSHRVCHRGRLFRMAGPCSPRFAGGYGRPWRTAPASPTGSAPPG